MSNTPHAASGPEPSPPRGWRRFRPNLTSRQRRVLFLLGIAELFDGYDAALVSFALKQIQAGLSIPESEIGRVAGTIRLGMIASFGVTILADRVGRRRLLLVTVIGFSVFTLLTAFARTADEFVWAQLIARAFIGAEILLAAVVIVEEFSAKDRGYGIGVLGALGALGYGLAANGLYFIDVIPYGWRALYALGALPLLVVAWLRRNLSETERFEQHRADRAGHGGLAEIMRPLINVFSMYPGRLAALSFVVMSFDFVHWVVFGFLAKTMQEVHGFSTQQVSVIVVVGGTLGILGNLVAGVLGDRVGRRRVMCGLIVFYTLCAYSFYNGSSSPVVIASWIGVIFAATGMGVVQKALGGELFPTSYRATAAGVRLVMASLGGYLGYSTESAIYPAALASLGDTPNAELLAHSVALTWMMPLLVIPAFATFLLPETARRELEDIAPELGGDRSSEGTP